jgi:PAS domain S-box-containing protein
MLPEIPAHCIEMPTFDADLSDRRVLELQARRLAAIIDSSEDAIVSKDLNGVIQTWNTSAERMFGYTADEAVGQSIMLIIPQERRSEEDKILARIRAGVTIDHFETQRRRKDGTLIDIALTVSPIRDVTGAIVGASKIARDVSRQKALEREAFRLAAIVDSSDDAIISSDLHGVVQTWNRAAERMFGYSAFEIVGRPMTVIVPPERWAEEDSVIARLLAGVPVEHFETIRQRKDGTTVDLSLSVSPIKTAAGTIIGTSKIARDISRQRALEREAFRLAAIVDSSEDAIVSKDLNGIVKTWNKSAERMFGYTAEEIVGRSITLLIPPERWPEEDNVLARIRAGQAIEHFETVRRRKDGSLIEISLSVSPIRTPSGVVIGASKIARDITVQRQLMRSVEEASRVKDEFLAMLSHELRTPLNAVLGYTRMLRLGHVTEDRQEHVMDIIERNAKMLSQLVSDVLDVSGIVTGKIQLKLANHDIAAVLAAAVDIVRPAADAKNVALHVEIGDASVPIRCDPDRVQQVFWNLLSNAVKFTPRGGDIDVRLVKQRGSVIVTVTDTGIGIAPSSLPYIFQRFWQGETGGGRDTRGLGLGLALARHFMELHGGTIQATSPGPGQGSTFTITLPLSANR